MTSHTVIIYSMISQVDIKSIRQELGLSQTELARKLKVASFTISRWERQLHRPSNKLVSRLLRLKSKMEGKRNGD